MGKFCRCLHKYKPVGTCNFPFIKNNYLITESFFMGKSISQNILPILYIYNFAIFVCSKLILLYRFMGHAIYLF